jgi:hypothetical protein
MPENVVELKDVVIQIEVRTGIQPRLSSSVVIPSISEPMLDMLEDILIRVLATQIRRSGALK